MSSTWVYQDAKQLAKRGEKAASWYVGWFDPDGKKKCKSCGPGPTGKRNAGKLAEQIAAQLLTGTYDNPAKKSWEDFRKEYRSKVIDGMGVRNRMETLHALEQFERLLKPKKVHSVTTRAVAEYVAQRRKEPGMKKGSTVSVATINKEMRHLRAVFRKAARWGYLPKVPDFDFLKEPGKLHVYVSPEHFAKIYLACSAAKRPSSLTVAAVDWWQGLLVLAMLTGWRIGQILALRWEDVDLAKGTALSRAEDNKGKRDQLIQLHPLVVEHLRRVQSFEPVVFPWNHRRMSLFDEFARIQQEAGVKPACDKPYYTFHDLRRAFATLNADRLTADVLQVLMQHKSYTTTQRYIAMARQMNPALQNLFVPDLGKPAAGSETA